MEFHLTHSFPIPAARLWGVVVDNYVNSAEWDRSVHRGSPVLDSNPIDGIEHSAWVWETTFGQLTVQILDVHREGEGGVMAYTISEGLPGIVQDGLSTWTISSDGPVNSRLNIDVDLTTNFIGTVVSPILRMMFRRADGQMIDDLYHYSVTGTPSKAKQKAIAKRQTHRT
jgi:hypothetical protein